jgi:hypothetical protein
MPTITHVTRAEQYYAHLGLVITNIHDVGLSAGKEEEGSREPAGGTIGVEIS